jgi:hypothetical protein
VRSQLHNGRLTLFLEPIKSKLKVGDTIKLTVGLMDDAMPLVVSDEIQIRIIEEEIEIKKPKKPKAPEPPTDNGTGGGKKQGEGPEGNTHGLPKYILLTEDGREIPGHVCEKWPEDFTREDGGIAEVFGENDAVYKINYDNAYHIKYRQNARGDVARDAITEKYLLGMRIMMLGFEHAFRKRTHGGDSVAEAADDFRRMAARGAASTVLALAENLPKILDSSGIGNSDAE